MFVEDHEIRHDPLQSPVVVHLQELPYARQAIRGRERCQEYRPVTGDSKTPQLLLAHLVAVSLLDQSLESGMRVEQMSAELLVQRGIGGSDAELSQFCLGVRPRKVECTARTVGVVVEIGQL